MTIDKIQQLSLKDIQQKIESLDERDISLFINEHVAIASHVPFHLVNLMADQPIRLPEMRVFVLRKGVLRTTLNLLPIELSVGELLFVSSGSIVQNVVNKTSIDGMGFSISPVLFHLAFAGQTPKAFSGHIRHFKVSLTEVQLAFVENLVELMRHTLQQPRYDARVFLPLVASFFWFVNTIWEEQTSTQRQDKGRDELLFANFIDLVNLYAKTEHQIGFYADRLFLSARYMSTLVKSVSGRSAKEWIDEALVTALKIDLKYSKKSLKEIASESHFPSMSFFSKYFKRMTGKTPLAYRQEESRKDEEQRKVLFEK